MAKSSQRAKLTPEEIKFLKSQFETDKQVRNRWRNPLIFVVTGLVMNPNDKTDFTAALTPEKFLNLSHAGQFDERESMWDGGGRGSWILRIPIAPNAGVVIGDRVRLTVEKLGLDKKEEA